jgi:circadian clock protein KaiB
MPRQKKQKDLDRFLLKLYIAGKTENSLRAQKNIEQICEKFLNQNYELEVIDIIEDPRRALKDGVIVTPTLVKVLPHPEVKVIGDLSDEESIRAALGLSE